MKSFKEWNLLTFTKLQKFSKRKSIARCVLINAFLVGACLVCQLYAQPRYYQPEPKNNEGTILTANFLFGFHKSLADLDDRFGNHMSTGLGMDFITSTDWLVGAQWNFYFGNVVNEDVLASLRSSDGLIFADNSNIADVRLRQRGYYLGGHVGRVFRINANKRSGIRATVGAGIYQHKVRIQDDAVVKVPQLNSDYKKGYDQLSNGLGLTQFIGYQHLDPLRRANFIIGVELTQGFTQNRRNFNFGDRVEVNDSRFDMTLGLRIEWLLPFYLGENADEIRY